MQLVVSVYITKSNKKPSILCALSSTRIEEAKKKKKDLVCVYGWHGLRWCATHGACRVQLLSATRFHTFITQAEKPQTTMLLVRNVNAFHTESVHF